MRLRRVWSVLEECLVKIAVNKMNKDIIYISIAKSTKIKWFDPKLNTVFSVSFLVIRFDISLLGSCESQLDSSSLSWTDESYTEAHSLWTCSRTSRSTIFLSWDLENCRFRKYGQEPIREKCWRNALGMKNWNRGLSSSLFLVDSHWSCSLMGNVRQ